MVRNSREKSTDGFYDVTKTWLTAEHDISAGDTTKVSDSRGNGVYARTASIPAAVEPIDTRLDHVVPSQAETPTDDGGGQSIADTPSFDELADDNPDAMSIFESSMPSMLNLQAAGLRRSSRILAAQESKSNYK